MRWKRVSPLSSRFWLYSGAVIVVGWRVAAHLFPHTAGTDPPGMRVAFALMGLWFACCGVWVGRRLPGRSAALFAGFGLANGIHWGGPLGWGPEGAQNLLLATYVVVSTALAQGFFLHLAMNFAESLPAARNRGWLIVVYLPALAGAVMVAGLVAAPTSRVLMNAIALLFPIGVAYSLIAGTVWIRRWFVATREQRSAGRLSLVVGVLVGSWIPHALVSAVGPVAPPYDGLFDLPMAAIPAVLALALFRQARHSD